MPSTIHRIYCMRYQSISTYICLYILYMRSWLHFRRNLANNDKRNFSRFTLTLNTQHPFFFLSKHKVHIVYALPSDAYAIETVIKKNYHSNWNAATAGLHGWFIYLHILFSFHFFIFSSPFLKRHINVIYIVRFCCSCCGWCLW